MSRTIFTTEPWAPLTNEPVGSGIAVPERELSQSLRQAWSSIPYSGVQTKEACNKDDNHHYADDVENVHCVLRSRHARFQYESAALE
jgi:hypothetical protein